MKMSSFLREIKSEMAVTITSITLKCNSFPIFVKGLNYPVTIEIINIIMVDIMSANIKGFRSVLNLHLLVTQKVTDTEE